MEIAIALYDNFTALDCIGPYEVLSRLPGARVRFVSTKGGLVTSDTRMLSIPTEPLADVPSPDIVLVPGGPGDEGAIRDQKLLAWLRKAHATTTWTTSVCTGSLVLAAAGILDGLEATTHWARYERLAELGAKPVARRVVRPQQKIFTAAGVSAGIDMAIELVRHEVSDDYAQALQLAIEYDPAPPFDCGSPEKAPAHVVEMIRAVITDPARREAVAS